MAYIDKIKSGKKTFYYLGKTIRIGEDKWKKIRIKLGEKEPTREEVRKKLKELRLEEYKVFYFVDNTTPSRLTNQRPNSTNGYSANLFRYGGKKLAPLRYAPPHEAEGS